MRAGFSEYVKVDPALQNINVFADIGTGVPLLNALGQLAIAAGGYIKFERDGTYRMTSLDYSAAPIRTLDFNNIWGKPQITQKKAISAVEVNYRDSTRYVSRSAYNGGSSTVNCDFIIDGNHGEQIGLLWLEFANKRLQYSISYRGDMSIEAGDVIRVETDYGFRSVLVLEHEITYDGDKFLQGLIGGVELGISPPGARENMILSHSGFGRYAGKTAQLQNNRFEMSSRWGSLELNRATLGGGYRYIDPATTEQVGEWSQALSDANGYFAAPPYILMTFNSIFDIFGCQIAFDDKGQEWATEVMVTYYDMYNAIIAENWFTNNEKNLTVIMPQISTKAVLISILRWNLPGRFAKVCQVMPFDI